MRDMTKENFIYCKYCGAKLKKDYIGKYCGTRNCQWEFGIRYPPNEGLLTPAPADEATAAPTVKVEPIELKQRHDGGTA